MALKENYKDDILDVSVNTKRKYRMTENSDGTVSLDDETVYTQEGDSFGASDMNAMAHAINNTSSDAEHTSYDNTTSGLQATNVQDAVDEINDNLAQTPITVGGETLSTIDDKLNYLIEGKDFSNVGVGGVNRSGTIPATPGHQYIIACGEVNYGTPSSDFILSGCNIVKSSNLQVSEAASSRLAAIQLFIVNATANSISTNDSGAYKCMAYFDLGVVQNN